MIIMSGIKGKKLVVAPPKTSCEFELQSLTEPELFLLTGYPPTRPRRLKHQKESEKHRQAHACPVGELCYNNYFQMELNVADIAEAFVAEFSKKVARYAKICEATRDDSKRLVVLHNRAFLTAADPYAPVTEEDMAKVLAFQDNVVLIATIRGEDAGFIILGCDLPIA